MQDIIRDLLIKIGEDPDREGLKNTPERFEKSITFLTQGYRQDPAMCFGAPSSTSSTTRW